YRRVEDRCDAVTQTLDDWRACMRPGFRLEEALRHVRSDLFAAEAALDATDHDGFARVAPCLARSLNELAEALEVLGAELPDGLATVRGLVARYGGACRAPEEG